MTAFPTAVRFLTVIPWGAGGERPEVLGRSLTYFPAVGLLLGGALALADRGLQFFLPAPVVNALLLLLSMGLTGGMHFDGFLDCCDALPGVRSPEERLRILQDPRVGAFGVMGGITLLLFKYGALLSLTGPRAASLILFPALGRWGMVYAVCRYPYDDRQGEGTGTVFGHHKGLGSLLGATAIALTATLFLGGLRGIVAFGLTWLVAILVARYTLKKLPGLTGDVYGAINEFSEAVALCALASAI